MYNYNIPTYLAPYLPFQPILSSLKPIYKLTDLNIILLLLGGAVTEIQGVSFIGHYFISLYIYLSGGRMCMRLLFLFVRIFMI